MSTTSKVEEGLPVAGDKLSRSETTTFTFLRLGNHPIDRWLKFRDLGLKEASEGSVESESMSGNFPGA